MINTAIQLQTKAKKMVWKKLHQKRVATYLKSDRRPWSPGYDEYRLEYLAKSISDPVLAQTFRDGGALPNQYGFRLDARVIEIPWVLSRLSQSDGEFLDAGSALNHECVLKSEALKNKRTTIVTLAPEGQAFWQLGVSYVFGDMRNLFFKDEWFSEIACISTIEHIGMDNTMYAEDLNIAKRSDPGEFVLAVRELKRVLKPGGVLYITFPFGRYENHGWFQQFDAALVDTLFEAFGPSDYKENIFQYHPDGWQRSNREQSADCQFFDVHESKYRNPQSTIEYPTDYPAGERAVACIELVK